MVVSPISSALTARPELLKALSGLNKAGVDYLLIGVMAVNHYAANESSVYSTMDCDVLLRPTQTNLVRALASLRRQKYRLYGGVEPLEAPDRLLCRRLLEKRATVTARKIGKMPLDWSWRRRASAMPGCAAVDGFLASQESGCRALPWKTSSKPKGWRVDRKTRRS